MQNLLDETLKDLATNGKSSSDVLWVGTDKISSTWSIFAALADFDYDPSYGRAEINTDLLIVGKDWWLERGEYDGSEWWEFKTLPNRPAVGKLELRRD